MKEFGIHRKLGAAILFCALTSSVAFGQLPGGGSSLSTAMMKLFGDVTAFTAHADVQMLDAKQAERVRTPMNFTALDGKLRVEIDMTQMHGSKEAEKQLQTAVNSLKQLGMEHLIILLRPDKETRFTIYPNAKSYVSETLTKEEVETADRNLKIEKTPLGKETVDGHPCVKNQIVVRNGTNVLAATTWNATDLKDFPVQIVTKEGIATSVMHFKQVQFIRPDAKQFEPPSGYARFNNSQTLMLARSTKAQNGAK
jgi:hypothetical protein